MGQRRSGKAAHRQNDNVAMSKASPNKIRDNGGNAPTLLPSLLVGCDADAKSWQGIAGKQIERQDTLNVARNRFATPPQAHSHSDCGAFQNATSIEPVALSKPPQAYSHGRCGGVAFSNPLPEQDGVRRNGQKGLNGLLDDP
jgi:hypothetical protein